MKRMMRIDRVSLLALTITALAPAAARAQADALSQGRYAVGGAASLSSLGSDGGGGRSTSIDLSPRVLYFVRDGVALGGTARYSRTSFENSSTSRYSVGPSAAVYFGDPAESSLRPFLSADAGLGEAVSKSSGFDVVTERRATLTHVGASAGFLDLLTSSVGVHGEVFYMRDSYDGASDGYIDSFGAAFGFDIFLGG